MLHHLVTTQTKEHIEQMNVLHDAKKIRQGHPERTFVLSHTFYAW
jgi:hypothetical protein